jgi:hypothetical protein
MLPSIPPVDAATDNNKTSIEDETKVFVCKLLRDMNKSDAKERRVGKIIIVLWTSRHEFFSLCV